MEHFDATEWVDHITYIKRYLDSQIHAEDLVLEDTWEQTWVFVFVLFCFLAPVLHAYYFLVFVFWFF